MSCVAKGRWTPVLPAAVARLVPVPGSGRRHNAGHARWLEEKETRLGNEWEQASVVANAVGAESSGGRQ